jgi:hypothetical protein
LTVCNFGIQLKLSHYGIHASRIIQAKLLKGYNSQRIVTPRDPDRHKPIAKIEGVEPPLPVALYAIPGHPSALHQVDPRLCNPCRYDLQGPNLLHLSSLERAIS